MELSTKYTQVIHRVIHKIKYNFPVKQLKISVDIFFRAADDKKLFG